jgi:predicted type IV restriction endonuclease
LTDSVLDYLQNIKKENIITYDEATLKQTTILRIFSLLGWDIFNQDEVKPEYTISGKKVDYALFIESNPKVFIEVKRPGENLSVHQEQLLNYSFMQGIRLAILTNGLTWWFYLPLQEANWEQRK